MKLKLTKDYVAFREEENIFRIKKSESGIITSLEDVAFESQDSGNMEKLDRIIGLGIVTHVGPEVKYVNVGDAVYYDRRSIRALPFGEEPVWHINEGNLLGYVENEDGVVDAAVDAYKAEQEAEARKASLRTSVSAFGTVLPGANAKKIITN